MNSWAGSFSQCFHSCRAKTKENSSKLPTTWLTSAVASHRLNKALGWSGGRHSHILGRMELSTGGKSGSFCNCVHHGRVQWELPLLNHKPQPWQTACTPEESEAQGEHAGHVPPNSWRRWGCHQCRWRGTCLVCQVTQQGWQTWKKEHNGSNYNGKTHSN